MIRVTGLQGVADSEEELRASDTTLYLEGTTVLCVYEDSYLILTAGIWVDWDGINPEIKALQELNTHKITVGPDEPESPSLYDVWIDTN